MPLPQDLQRALSDKIYERRKAGALQIEQLARGLVANGGGDRDAVEGLLADLASLARSPTNANARKGGALALAAAAVALAPAAAAAAAAQAAAVGRREEREGATEASETGPSSSSSPPPFFDLLSPDSSPSRPGHRGAPELVTGTLLSLLDDRDARVRYYAAEATYNVARVAASSASPCPGLLSRFWPAAFAGSLGLAADADAGVRQAGLMLDGALRDAAAVPGALDCSSGGEGELPSPGLQLLFSIAAALKAPSAAARRTAVAWTASLCRCPEVDLSLAAPALVGGLLDAAASDNEPGVKASVGASLARLRDDAERSSSRARERGSDEEESSTRRSSSIDVAAVVAEVGARAAWRPRLLPTQALLLAPPLNAPSSSSAAAAAASAVPMGAATPVASSSSRASPAPPGNNNAAAAPPASAPPAVAAGLSPPPPPAVSLAVASARAAALDTLADWAARAPTALLPHAARAISVALPALADPEARVAAAGRRAEGALLAAATRAAAAEAAALAEEAGGGGGAEQRTKRYSSSSRRFDPVEALDAVFAAVEEATAAAAAAAGAASSPSERGTSTPQRQQQQQQYPPPPLLLLAPPATTASGVEAIRAGAQRWATAVLRSDFATASAARAAAAAARANGEAEDEQGEGGGSEKGRQGRRRTNSSSSLLLRRRGARLLSETLASLVCSNDRLAKSGLSLLTELTKTAAAEEEACSVEEAERDNDDGDDDNGEENEEEEGSSRLVPRLLSGLASALADPQEDKRLGGRRGVSAIRAVAAALSAKQVFSELAAALSSLVEKRFSSSLSSSSTAALAGASAASHTLIVALVMAPEAGALRALLAGSEEGEGDQGEERDNDGGDRSLLFERLAAAAAPSLHATLSLCLLSRAYDFASAVLFAAAGCGSSAFSSPGLGDLVAADALARSLEAPHWTRLRLALLSPEDRPGLERCLRALLAFLPQGDAFRSIEARLRAAPKAAEVTAMTMISSSSSAKSSSSSSKAKRASIEPRADYGRLLALFRRARKSGV